MFHVFIYLIAGLSMACQIDTSPKIGESADSVEAARPALVDVPSSDVEVGFSNGRIRKEVSLDGYRITKHPITVEQYKACMKADTCEEPAENACAAKIDQLSQEESPNAEASPVLCVGHEQAKAYCEWIGGELPNLSQWLLAARGKKPKLFSWGDEPPECDQHPMARKIRSYIVSRLPRSRARALLDKSNKENRCEKKRRKLFEMTTGKHPTGASPFGVEDVLITPGELIRPDEGSRFSACGSRTHGCVAFGQFPGVIDSVEPVYFYKRKQKKGYLKLVSSVIHPYGFRCVFEEE